MASEVSRLTRNKEFRERSGSNPFVTRLVLDHTRLVCTKPNWERLVTAEYTFAMVTCYINMSDNNCSPMIYKFLYSCYLATKMVHVQGDSNVPNAQVLPASHNGLPVILFAPLIRHRELCHC